MFRYNLASWLFRRRFGTNGGHSYCSFTEHWGGYLHNAYLTIEPGDSIASTRHRATARFGELCQWLHTTRFCFCRKDRVQIVVGIPFEVKSGGNQIFKGWLPASALRNLRRHTQPSELESLGGGCIELPTWTSGLFDDCEDKTPANNARPQVDVFAYIAGQLASWPRKHEMASILRRAGLSVTVGQYSIRVDDCHHFVFQEYGGDLGDPRIDADADSPEQLLDDAGRVSRALAAANVRHRFELYDEHNAMVGYLHHNWPRGE